MEHSILFTIQEEVNLVAEAIKSVLELEVIIYDQNHVVVAATGGGQHAVVGEQVRGHIIKEVLKTDQPIYNLNPGFHDACKSCVLYKNCAEKADVSYPLKHEGKNVGVISLTTFTKEQKAEFERKHDILSNYLDKMADLISSKINAESLLKKYLSMSQTLQVAIRSMNEGIIAADHNGRILEVNRSAKHILHIRRDEVLQLNLLDMMPDLPKVLFTGKGFTDRDYSFIVNGEKINVFGSAIPLEHNEHIIGVVLSFKDQLEVQKFAYSITSEVDDSNFDIIVGKSKALLETKAIAKQVSATDSTVLFLGESGTGKELFARAVHNNSHRADKPFRAINCAAIPEALLESELFGYSEGAFTGARKKGKPGKFELANGGTIFLDEIGDMPLHLQVKILRVLQERKVERIGANESVDIDVRVLAATNKNLEKMVKDGEFREDLYYRLHVIPVHIPPLRERIGDVPVLLHYFVNHYMKITEKEIKGFSPDALELLSSYHWPGNIRELQNTVEYAINMASEQWVTCDNLPARLREVNESEEEQELTLSEMEEKMIKKALDKYGDTLDGKKKVAQTLGINIATLYRKINKFEINRKMQM
ncbi:transcriptional regulator [Bacillus freudenreichii]|nr:transcriptional regulator [Bacillus freudenreichii]